MSFYFLFTLFILLSFRIALAFIERKNALITDGDAMGHLTYVKEYYRTGGKKMDLSWLFILDESDYPNGFHKLFYFLRIPVACLEKYGGYLPTFFDAALFCVIAIAMYFFGGDQYTWLLFFPFLRCFFGNIGRAAHFSERAFGVLLGNLYMFSVVAYWLTSYPYWLLFTLAFFSIFSVSSKFTWQATAFTSTLLFLFTFDFYFILVYLASILLSSLLTKGYSWNVLSGLIRHSYWYKTHLAPRSPVLRGNYKEFFAFQPLKRYIYMLFTNSPCRIITDNPLYIVIFLTLFSDASLDIWAKWALTGPVLTLLIATKPLKFLGEPERYLEFSIIPVFVYLSRLHIELSFTFAVTCLTTASIFTLHFLLYFRSNKNSSKREQEMLDLAHAFEKIRGATILTIPFRLSFFLGYRNSCNKFVTLFSNIGKGASGEAYRWLLKDRYPFVRGDLHNVIQRFNINYIVISKGEVKQMNEAFSGGYYDLTPFLSVFENTYFSILKVE